MAPDLVKIIKQANQEVPDFLSNYAGGAAGSADQFGGRDMRSTKQTTSSAPAAHGGGGDDEEW